MAFGGVGEVEFVPVPVPAVEDTGSYGAGLARHVTTAGVRVVEVGRSDRQDRRRQGKSDLRVPKTVPPGQRPCRARSSVRHAPGPVLARPEVG